MVMREEIQKNIKKKNNGLQSSHLTINESNTHTFENSNSIQRYKIKTPISSGPEIIILIVSCVSIGKKKSLHLPSYLGIL